MDISRLRTFRRDALRLERVERPLKFSCKLGLLLLPFVPVSSSPVHPFMSMQICHKRTFRMSFFVVSSKHLFVLAWVGQLIVAGQILPASGLKGYVRDQRSDSGLLGEGSNSNLTPARCMVVRTVTGRGRVQQTSTSLVARFLSASDGALISNICFSSRG